jgi:hypothetical protein
VTARAGPAAHREGRINAAIPMDTKETTLEPHPGMEGGMPTLRAV